MLGHGEAVVAAAEAHLAQPRAGAHQDGEGARTDFDIERPGIAFRHLVEAAGAVADDASEDVQPPRRALGIGRGADHGRQLEAFLQRHQIDAAALEHRAARQVDFMQLERLDALGHRMAGAGQEARAHAERDIAQAQVEAGGLYLVAVKGALRQDRALLVQRLNQPRRKHALRPVLLLVHAFGFPLPWPSLAIPAIDANRQLALDHIQW